MAAGSPTRAASSQPIPTPITADGVRMTRFRGEKSRRKAHTLTQSCTMRIGNTIAAALTGEVTSDKMGPPSEPRPENPPFDKPYRTTTVIATR